MMLYNQFEVFVQNNGFISKIFNKTRGVNQGCPASPQIYVHTCECMNHLIQQNKDIRGIEMKELKNVLSQFADDTSAYLQFDPLVIEGFCSSLQKVEENLGLKVSYEKTNLYRVGSLAHSDAKCYTSKQLNWTSENINTLGVEIACDGSYVENNFKAVIAKMKVICSDWNNRKLTLMGKIVVINTLMASLFVYKMSTTLHVKEEELKETEKLIHSFLWEGRNRGRVAMTMLKKAKEDGGLRLVDLKAKQNALQIQNIFRMDNFLEECAYRDLQPDLRAIIWRCNIHEKHVL